MRALVIFLLLMGPAMAKSEGKVERPNASAPVDEEAAFWASPAGRALMAAAERVRTGKSTFEEEVNREPSDEEMKSSYPKMVPDAPRQRLLKK